MCIRFREMVISVATKITFLTSNVLYKMNEMAQIGELTGVGTILQLT